MDKVKGITIIIIAVVSVVATIFIANMLLDTTSKVNQGNFRISDVVIKSTATLTEVQDKEIALEKLSDLTFDISQTNDVSILLESNSKIKDMYIDNLVVTEPALKGNMNFGQSNYEKYVVAPELTNIELHPEQKDGKYIINLCIDNDNVLRDKSVDESVKEIQYDAKIFDILKVDRQSLKFTVSFDLYITDETGKTVTTSLSLNMPTEETFTEGMSILKQDVSKYIFTFVNN